jgi:hypothetical protein
MAFPSVAATNTSTAAASTTPSVSLPASISAGDLLLIAVYTGSGSTVTATGWTSVYSNTNIGSGTLAILYKIASGSEGASVTVANSPGFSSAHLAYRITGAHASQAPEAGTAATGFSSNPDPPSFDPSGWGTEDTLWIAVYVTTNGTVTGYSSGYLSGITASDGTYKVGWCAKGANAASENPGTGTLSGFSSWGANTLAVRPSGGGGGGGSAAFRLSLLGVGL